jgi:hypothetical protein
MARQSHTPLTALGTKPSAYDTANAADLTMTAADAANYEEVAFTGSEIIIAHNTGGSAQLVTVTSIEDSHGRSDDITEYSVGAGEYAVFGPFDMDGWRQTGGKLYFQADSSDVKFGVVKITRLGK